MGSALPVAASGCQHACWTPSLVHRRLCQDEQANLFAGRRLKTTFDPYFLPSSFASVKRGCFGKQQLWAAFAGGAFCGCAHRFSSSASSPAFQPCVSVSQPACSALPIRRCWAGRALSWLPLPHQPLPVAADELREACLAYNPISQQCRACWRSRRGSPGKGLLVAGRPGFGEAGAGCAQRRVPRRLRDPQEELTAGTGVSLETCWKSLHDLGILSRIFLVR